MLSVQILILALINLSSINNIMAKNTNDTEMSEQQQQEQLSADGEVSGGSVFFPDGYGACTPEIWKTLALELRPKYNYLARYNFYENHLMDQNIVAWGYEESSSRNFCGEFRLFEDGKCRWVAGDAPDLFIAISDHLREGCRNGTYDRHGRLNKFDMFDFELTDDQWM